MARCTAVIVALLAGAVAGCPSSVFVCGGDSDCAGAPGGACEASGFCSFDDESCDSGRRYGEHAGDGLAGTCVDVGETTSGSSSTASTTAMTTQSTTTTATTTDPTTSATSIDSDDTQPVADTSSSTGADGCPPGWWDCAWSHRLELSLAPIAVRVPGSIPVAVTLTPDRWDASTAQPQAGDLRFVDSTGAVIPHELESTGTATVAWIRWPDRAAAPVVVYWGNPLAEDAQAPASVWQDGHEAVWHMADGTDSTGAHTLGEFGTEPAIGRIADASSFADSYMQGDEDDDLGSLLGGPATIEAWIWLESFGDLGRGRIIDNATDHQPDDGWTFQVRETQPVAALQFEVGYAPGTEAGYSTSNVLALGQWQYVAVVHEAGVVQLYVDGTPREVSGFAGVGMPSLDAGVPVTIGRIASQLTGFFDGVIDEVRISTVARDPAWIATQWASGNDELLIYGAVEQQ